MKKAFYIFSFLCMMFSSCTFDTPQEEIRVGTASFRENVVELSVGEQKQIFFDVEPKDAIPYTKVEYQVSSSSEIISISEETANGCVISGLKNGNCVLIGKCEGFTSYLQVNVVGSADVEPYIVTPAVAYEMKKDQRKSFAVSLYGGSGSDNALFEFSSSDPDVISIEASGNSVVVSADGVGFSRITVTHPRAKYPSSVMVYSTVESEKPVYITTAQNVMQLGLTEGTQQFSVALVGSNSGDMAFGYRVTEGKEYVDVIGNNNYFSVTPVKEGVSILEISHPECQFPITVQLVVVKTTAENYIDSDNNFIVLAPNGSARVNCFVVGADDRGNNYKFTHENENPEIIEVTQVNNSFYIEGKKTGKSKIIVKNELCKNSHEICVVVQDNNGKADSHYITTGQNLIKTEKGKDTVLTMLLTGGNESDKNGFSWTVDDSSVIDVTTSFGQVKSIDETSSNLCATALITAKKVGIANIEVTHPKSSVAANVKVKVYPEHTLEKIPGEVTGTGIVKVIKGQDSVYEVKQVAGDEMITSLDWSTEDSSMAVVEGKGLTGIFSALESGVTKGFAGSSLMAHPHELSVVCGTREEVEKSRVLYTSDSYPEIMSGDTAYVEIKCSGEIDTSKYGVSINDSQVAKVRMSENILIIDGLKAGSTDITVSHQDALNPLTLILTVSDQVSLEKPLYFTYNRFESLVVGSTGEIRVGLVGGNDRDRNDISWKLEETDVVSIVGNGSSCRVNALKDGQAVLYAHSPKAEKDAKIIIYTASSQDELNKKVVLATDRTNYLSSVGKDIYVKVHVNNPEINRENIKWSCDNISMVRIDENYDNAYIRCLDKGNCTVTVSCGETSLKIFISIKGNEQELYEKDITVPSILELLVGDNKTIRAVTTGMADSEVRDIKWTVEDSKTVTIQGNGESCYLLVNKPGFTKINVSHEKLGIERQIQVVAVRTPGELQDNVVMALPKSYYAMGKGEELNLSLEFGNNSPSEVTCSNIKWECQDNNVISVVPNGRKASVKAIGEGIGEIRIHGDGIINTLVIKIGVSSSGTVYHIEGNKLVGILMGKASTIKVSLYDSRGREVMTGLNNFTYELSEKNIVDVLQADNIFQLNAVGTGQCYLRVRHPQAQDEFNILIYTAETQEQLDSYYPLGADRNSFLLGIGDEAVLCLNTINDEKTDMIRWSCSDASVCSYSGGRKELRVHGKKEGSCIFTASHPDSRDDVKFHVYVTGAGNDRNNIFIGTEQVIGLVKGEKYNTVVQTNISDIEREKLVWSSSNGYVSVEGNGSRAVLNPVNCGISEITVKYNSSVYRTIVAYVCETREEAERFCAHNIDRRYWVIGKGDTVNLKPLFGMGIPDIGITGYEDIYKNNVVEFVKKGGSLVVTGKNEGVACIRVSNPQTENTYDIFIEVNSKEDAEVEDTRTGYLTTTKTVYALNSRDTVNPVTVSVTPVDISTDDYYSINWEAEDSDIVTVIPHGEKCSVYANREGETVLKVSSIYSANTLNIRIVVSRDGVIYIPYIKPDVDTLEVSCGETGKITCTVENLKGYDSSQFSAAMKNGICEVQVLGNQVFVKGLKSGQDVLTVSYDSPDVDDINIVVSCKGVATDCIYLTTDTNYSVIDKNGTGILSAELVGFEELNGENFTWSVESQVPDEKGMEVCSVTGNGKSGICKGLNPGIAKIKVVHKNPDPFKSAVYPLYMTVKVSDHVNTSPVYISTQSNVVTLTEGNKSTVNVSLINGQESEYSLFDWSTSTEDIIRINAANNQCVITGLTAGVGRITVSHPSCLGQTMDIIVIVDAKGAGDMLYISTDSTVVEMSPNDSFKQLNVSLVGGTPEQNTLFSWNILSFESTVKNQDGTSNAVVELVGSQDSAILKPRNEGVAIIRVTNSATSHYLDIKVIITLYNKLKFATPSITVNQFDTAFVDVETPTGKTVIYESSDENVATVSGTSRKCIIEGVGVPEGKNTGTCVIKAHTSDGASSDELIVKVTRNSTIQSNFITTSANVVTLNTLDDSGGFVLSAKLNGSGAEPADDDELTWTIGDKSTKVISFGGASGSHTVKGHEVTIKPESAGEVTLVVHHEKAKNDKVIYVSVEQNAAKLTLSSLFAAMNIDTIESLSCDLTGVAASEIENVVWASSDSSICNIMQAGPDGTVKGRNCNIRSNAVGECAITCTYGSIVKQVSVFVKEEPSITIPNGNVKIAVGQKDILFKVEVLPKELYDKVQIEASSSIYAAVEKVLDHEKQECYIKVSATQIEGKTMVTAKLDSLIAKLTIVTSADVYMRLRDAQVYDSDGRLVETIQSPTHIQADVSSKKVRVHYSTEPAGIGLDNEAKIYSMEQLNDSKFSSSSSPFVGLSYGREDDNYSGPFPYYFELEPQSCGYAVIPFINSDSPGVALDVPVCFTDEKFEPVLTVRSENGYSRTDLENGIINIANADKITFRLDDGCVGKMVYKMKIESNPVEKDKFGIIPSSSYVQVTGVGDAHVKGTTLRSTRYVGTVTIKVYYPRYSNVSGVYTKTFIVNQEEWY